MQSPIFDQLDRLSRVSTPAGSGNEKKVYELLRERLLEELMKPTRIAVIGKCGVGKTSTINAIFGTDWKISHVKAATKSEQEYIYESDRGRLSITDLPGFGEDVESEAANTALYLKVLRNCEVALFVLKADTRDMLEVQRILQKTVVRAMPELARRIVIGLNQVDLVQPGMWIEEGNVPSREQERSIRLVINERYWSIRKVCPISRNQIVAYSATRRYHLVHLFHAMIASTFGEAWALDAKKKIADWREFVNPKYLPPGLHEEKPCPSMTRTK